MSVRGIDIYQRNSVPNLADVHFIFHKVTQGNFFVDNQYNSRHLKYAKDRLWGGYVFFSALNPVNSQVRMFVDHADLAPGEIAILDFEDWQNEWSSFSHHKLATDADAFMHELKRLLPKNRCLLYCNRWTYNNIVKPFHVYMGDGLWIASPDAKPNMPYLFWQQNAVNGVDIDVANFSDVGAMLRWAGQSGGEVADEMGICKLGDKLVLAVQGTDRELYLEFLNADGTVDSNPPSWTPTNATIASQPSVASRDGVGLWATWLDARDRSVIFAHNPDVLGNGKWDLQDLGGIGTGAPTLYADSNYVVILVKGVKGELYLNVWSTPKKEWSGWQDMHGQAA